MMFSPLQRKAKKCQNYGFLFRHAENIRRQDSIANYCSCEQECVRETRRQNNKLKKQQSKTNKKKDNKTKVLLNSEYKAACATYSE